MTLRIVHVVRFLPLTLTYGQVQVQRMDLTSFLQSIDQILTKMETELVSRVGNKRVKSISLEVSPVSLGQVSGLLIVMYALVEDNSDRVSQG